MASEARAGQCTGAFLLGFAFLACAESPLVPLVPSDQGVAVVRRSGVELSAEIKPGLQQVPEGLIAMRIAIVNQRKGAIHVDPADIELRGESRSFAAVEPDSIRPTRPAGLGLDPASPYAAAQAQPSIVGGDRDLSGFSMDPSATYTTPGRSSDPSRHWIVDSAFNGGYFENGEQERGYVYFQAPADGSERLTLTVKVRKAPAGEVIETLQIPYAAQG